MISVQANLLQLVQIKITPRDMSTPATLKQMELAREKSARRQRNYDNVLVPLSAVMAAPRYYNYRIRSNNIDFTVDRAGGRQYTSFESNRREPPRRFLRKALTPPMVEDVPIEIDTDDYKINPDDIICFSGRQNFLSNLYPVTLTVEGHDYLSVEHYYQACKLYTLAGANVASEIRNVVDSGQVKMIAKKILRSANVAADKVEEWKRTQGLVLLYHAVMHKFVQNSDLREKLLATGDAILAHTYEFDNIYATGCDREKMIEWAKTNSGQIIKIPTKIDAESLVYVPLAGEGKNVLGFLNMKVRHHLRNYKPTSSETVDPILLAAMSSLQLGGRSKNGNDD